jgi:hypothetical protein
MRKSLIQNLVGTYGSCSARGLLQGPRSGLGQSYPFGMGMTYPWPVAWSPWPGLRLEELETSILCLRRYASHVCVAGAWLLRWGFLESDS